MTIAWRNLYHVHENETSCDANVTQGGSGALHLHAASSRSLRAWNADTDFDVRLQDVPLTNRRPDVVVYRADTIDITPTRPEHVLLVAEVVSPGSGTTDRIVKVDQYAKAGIAFYWRIEQTATGIPLVYTYVLDLATKTYRDGDVFTGVIKVAAPFPVEIDLGQI